MLLTIIFNQSNDQYGSRGSCVPLLRKCSFEQCHDEHALSLGLLSRVVCGWLLLELEVHVMYIPYLPRYLAVQGLLR